MTYRNSLLLASSLLVSQINYCHSIDTGSITRNLRALNRVDQVDKTDAICEAKLPEDQDAPTGVTHITFYYSVESSETVTYPLMQNLDRMLYYAIGDAVLWCSQNASTDDNGRRLQVHESNPKITEFTESHRNLSLEDARRLGIISFNSAPSDLILDNEQCAHTTESSECVIVEGKMALMAHQTDSLDIIVASILDAVQEAMDGDVLIPDEDCLSPICSVDKVRWLGTTIEEARAGGPVVAGADGDDTSVSQAAGAGGDDDDNVAFVAYAAIPLALLLLMSYLIKKKRRLLTAGDLDDEDYVRVGTGDPPKSFHEGMYHYTKSGARYLSTNCPDCEMTRRLGFANEDDDLPALAEGRMYDRSRGGSSDDSDLMSYDGSTFRKMHRVQPSSNRLSLKHSTIDVHQCTSATCPICKYKPQDPSFISSPRMYPMGGLPNHV
eukprot:CAMPEP_0113602248 /NCGR_PEP_ID=MMETSP0017_2-20120614/654_1 /TAXON_ID=2856 /ORGANISM="Cylindrotheca closterium" /LENGTH=437 /DNA_ID=CAMNT_0000510581 /DNA_START=77 /DNA_END=1390 /DNA_ORIENTATION=+ /assembly_acc=CAM_ASM_000147